MFCCLVLLLAACIDMRDKQNAMMPQVEMDLAKSYVEKLKNKDFTAIEADFYPKFSQQEARSALMNMSQFFPDEKLLRIDGIASQIINLGEQKKVDLVLQYTYEHHWILVSINFLYQGNKRYIFHFEIKDLDQSVEKTFEFSLINKTATHYLILALAISIFLFVIFSAIKCIRTKKLKMKWLWLIFILSGFMTLKFNWTTGGMGFYPISFLLLSAGFFKPIFGPLILSVAFPFGAVIFLLKQRFFNKNEEAKPVNETENATEN